MMATSKQLTTAQKDSLILTLKERFSLNQTYHPDLSFDDVLSHLNQDETKLWSLFQMEETGGEPDVVAYDSDLKKFIFMDTAKETPAGRRNLCYDREALDARKKFKPENSAMDLVKDMGVELLDESDYQYLQSLGAFDLKTSSWILTPEAIRRLGGALFCDRRYNHVFVYHNGADSYYGVRGFRTKLHV